MRSSSVAAILLHEVELSAIPAQGAGGQNVNKVATAIHLRFDIRASSLPEPVKERLLQLNDQRITRDGVIVIKSQQHRTQEKNRAEALNRLAAMIRGVASPPKMRKPTRPTKAAGERRLAGKAHRGQVKSLRGKIPE